MRVISGILKGRSLIAPQTDRVKPTLDRVKEAIFDKIQFDISGSEVLDLFTGSGALGIEAYSRGALSVTMVDADTTTARKNIEKLDAKVELIQKDALKALESMNYERRKFDIILLDPPFKSDLGISAINYIDDHKMLKEDGIIVWEKSYGLTIPLELNNLCIDKIKKYGTIQVVYIVPLKV